MSTESFTWPREDAQLSLMLVASSLFLVTTFNLLSFHGLQEKGYTALMYCVKNGYLKSADFFKNELHLTSKVIAVLCE